VVPAKVPPSPKSQVARTGGVAPPTFAMNEVDAPTCTVLEVALTENGPGAGGPGGGGGGTFGPGVGVTTRGCTETVV